MKFVNTLLKRHNRDTTDDEDSKSTLVLASRLDFSLAVTF